MPIDSLKPWTNTTARDVPPTTSRQQRGTPVRTSGANGLRRDPGMQIRGERPAAGHSARSRSSHPGRTVFDPGRSPGPSADPTGGASIGACLARQPIAQSV